MAGLKDAFSPFNELITLMGHHWWMYPAGCTASILLRWLTIGVEVESQRERLEEIRRVKPGRKRS